VTTPLSEELAAVRGELVRVDAKAATLTGIDGLVLAYLSTQISHRPLPVAVLLGLAGACLAAALLIMLIGVLRPQLGPRGFGRYSQMTTAQVREDLVGDSAPEIEHAQAEDLRILSQIAASKFARARMAVDSSAAAVALMATALLTATIA
jgi:hypothetical protein